MKLYEIAISALLYNRLMDFNNTFQEFLKKTNDRPDLMDVDHRKALLKWLNEWGCRQFSRDYHFLALREILAWYKGIRKRLFPFEVPLWEMDEPTIESASKAYSKLALKTASFRERQGSKIKVTIGPTGASKILFAIRPNSMVAWDEDMRKGLGYDGSGAAYVEFLCRIREDIKGLKKECKKEGFRVEELPQKVGRPGSTLTQLISEYYYMTETRGMTVEDFQSLKSYLKWDRG